MKRIAATALALALSAASGSAFANHVDDRYGQDARYGHDDRYGSGYGYGGDYRDDYRRTRYVNVRVTSVHPIFDRSRSDRYCRDDGYSHRYDRGYGSSPRANGAALGAVVGGALGNQAGKGDGRKAATIAGAVIGGVIGAEVAGQNQRRMADGGYGYGDNRDYRDDRYVRCDYDRDERYRRDDRYGDQYGYGDRYGRGYEERVIGYNVAYRLDGRTYHTRTQHHPGNTLRVRVAIRPDGRRVALGI